MNLLICSAGRRVKLISYFKEELSGDGGVVMAADCDPAAPALHAADLHAVIPPIHDSRYIKEIKKLCHTYKLGAVLSLIDPELQILAEHKEEFEAEGIKVIVSNPEVVSICFDKLQTYSFLKERGISVIPSYHTLKQIMELLSRNELSFPLILKPRQGSASADVHTLFSKEQLLAAWEEGSGMIVQPYMGTQEYGVDSYIDMLSGETTQIFCKKKLKMRAGETDQSEAVLEPELLKLIQQLTRELHFYGPIDVDCFKTEAGFAISEINPRFGGGYPHAHESGQNFIRNIVRNLKGEANEASIGSYRSGSIMVKFEEIRMIE